MEEFEFFGVFYRTIVGTLIGEGEAYFIQNPEVEYSKRDEAFRKEHSLSLPEVPNPVKLGGYTTQIYLSP